MPETVIALIPLLRYLALPPIAGALASTLFDGLRSSLPQDAESPSPLRRLGARIRSWLMAPRYARYAALLLAALIGAAANAGLAHLTGGSVTVALDTALAACVAAIVGQIQHGWSLSADAPAPRGGIYEGIQSRLDEER
jgi:hypothetical protein